MAYFDNRKKREKVQGSACNQDKAMLVRAFHASLPGYKPTRLQDMQALARHLGLGSIRIKDEDSRFGLHAFKSLGGLWCAARCLQEKLGLPSPLTYEAIQAVPEQVRADMTFATATDGNHGRGVAFAARMFGTKAVVFMPSGSAEDRVENIRREGARVCVTDMDYDATVRLAAEEAEKNGWMLMQDTTDREEDRVCGTIMEGYLTLGAEILEEMDKTPTHIFLQAGVGTMAAALCAFFRSCCGEEPVISVVEAEAADCLYQTARHGDGRMYRTEGNMQTMMAGLCCGEPCCMAQRMLEKQADFYLTSGDDASRLGMRTLAAPMEGDPVIISGESGAVTTGLLVKIMQEEHLQDLRMALGLNEESRVLLISTEGATDRENYKKITEGTGIRI